MSNLRYFNVFNLYLPNKNNNFNNTRNKPVEPVPVAPAPVAPVPAEPAPIEPAPVEPIIIPEEPIKKPYSYTNIDVIESTKNNRKKYTKTDFSTCSDNFQLNKSKNNENIYLLQQFFIPNNIQRKNEILYTLKKNVQNPFINKIYLLNERIYTNEELGVTSRKIQQIIINHRMMYLDIFKVIKILNLTGYIIFSNSDIYYDKTIEIIKTSKMHEKKSFIALTRYEAVNPEKNIIRYNKNIEIQSQDTWILHSNFNIPEKYYHLFDFNFGIPGCDNKITYLFKILGYDLYNIPSLIKSYHVHMSNNRTYTKYDKI